MAKEQFRVEFKKRGLEPVSVLPCNEIHARSLADDLYVCYDVEFVSVWATKETLILQRGVKE